MPLGFHKATLFGVAGVSATGDVVLLHDQDYTNATSVSITSGINSTYGEYIFRFYNINPATDNAEFEFQAGSGYNTTMTTTVFATDHNESDSTAEVGYKTSNDQAQGTSYQWIAKNVGSDADQNLGGELHLFSPSSTTYAKQFYLTVNNMVGSDYTQNYFVAGYFNTTSALTQVDFKMSTGNFDGTIKMWGVK